MFLLPPPPAGIVAGLQSGVAKQALVHPVRVMGCDGSGTYGDIIAGLEWVANNYIAPAVLSLSIAMPASISLDTALSSIIRKKGIVAVRGAGLKGALTPPSVLCRWLL